MTRFCIISCRRDTCFICLLARENRRARSRVGSRNGVVNVDHQTGIRGLISAREGDESRGRLATTPRDGELGAGHVGLGASGGAGAVERDVLDAEQVVAGGDARGDLSRDLARALAGPGQSAGADVGALREDLEPDCAGAVPGRGRLARWHLGHVELQHARVRDGGVGCEADCVAGCDRHCLCAFVAGGELVASHLIRGHGWDWGWIREVSELSCEGVGD